jgi:hypothetical protein
VLATTRVLAHAGWPSERFESDARLAGDHRRHQVHHQHCGHLDARSTDTHGNCEPGLQTLDGPVMLTLILRRIDRPFSTLGPMLDERAPSNPAARGRA